MFKDSILENTKNNAHIGVIHRGYGKADPGSLFLDVSVRVCFERNPTCVIRNSCKF